MLQVGMLRPLWSRSGSSIRVARYVSRSFSTNLAAEQASTPPPPWLMLPSGFVDDSNGDSYHLFSVAEKKVHSLEKNFDIPWRRHLFCPEGNTVFAGSSSYGWLSLANKRNGKLFLFNPFGNPLEFSQTYIPLPPLESIRDCLSSFYLQDVISTTSNTELVDKDCTYHLIGANPSTPKKISKDVIVKLVMSSPPLSNSLTYNEDCLVMARIHLNFDCHRFVCCRPGDTTWTSLEFDGEFHQLDDFTYFSKDKLFYTLTGSGKLVAWDLLGNPNSKSIQSLVYNLRPPITQPTMTQDQKVLRYNQLHHYYLVDSSGDLLLVIRCMNSKDVLVDCSEKNKKWKPKVKKNKWKPKEWMEATFAFDVYKFDFVNKKWVYVPDLGDDRVLFLGVNSFSISLSDYPRLKGSISGNSIYFSFGHVEYGWQTKNNDYRFHDCGVYSLNDGSITTFLPECFLPEYISSQENQISASPFIWIHPQH